MNEERCSECQELWPEDELLEREDDGRKVCVPCSGLLSAEEISCRYDETG